MVSPASLAGCEILERIGVGAESAIYRARERVSQDIVALKHVVIDKQENEKYLRHIRNEYRVLRSLQDGPERTPPPGIVKAHRLLRKGLLRKRKERVLVMDYVDGPDLRREHRYPLGQTVDILTQVARAITALHRRGFIHGDLKPENIVVSHDGQATVVDFGFACAAGSAAGSIRGTRDYMAPEQLNKGRLTEKTDLYNFGASMYFLLTGRYVPAIVPPQGATHFLVQRKVKTPPPRSIKPGIPAALDALIMRCLEKEPIERPASMTEALDILSSVRDRFVR